MTGGAREPTEMNEAPHLEFALRITAALEPPIEQGTWDGQRRRA